MSSNLELKIYQLDSDSIASIDIPDNENSPQHVETVVIVDRSGSMGKSVYKIVHSILPHFFENLSYESEQEFYFIAFESATYMEKIKIGDLKEKKIFSAGGTHMKPAVVELRKLFEEFKEKNVDSVRILTISDGEIFDPGEKKFGSDWKEAFGKLF